MDGINLKPGTCVGYLGNTVWALADRFPSNALYAGFTRQTGIPWLTEMEHGLSAAATRRCIAKNQVNLSLVCSDIPTAALGIKLKITSLALCTSTLMSPSSELQVPYRYSSIAGNSADTSECVSAIAEGDAA